MLLEGAPPSLRQPTSNAVLARLMDLDDLCLLQILQHLTPLPDLFHVALCSKVCHLPVSPLSPSTNSCAFPSAPPPSPTCSPMPQPRPIPSVLSRGKQLRFRGRFNNIYPIIWRDHVVYGLSGYSCPWPLNRPTAGRTSLQFALYTSFFKFPGSLDCVPLWPCLSLHGPISSCVHLTRAALCTSYSALARVGQWTAAVPSG